MPQGTKLDEKYVLNTDTKYTDNDNHYVFVGYTASCLHYNKSMAKWELRVRTDTDTWYAPR